MDFSDHSVIADILPDFVPLADRADLYFLRPPHSIDIALDSLVALRMRPDGVRNAARYMREAAAGRTSKRTAISVARRQDGKWDVLDGNSTVAVARLSGWRTVPCLPVAIDPE